MKHLLISLLVLLQFFSFAQENASWQTFETVKLPDNGAAEFKKIYRQKDGSYLVIVTMGSNDPDKPDEKSLGILGFSADGELKSSNFETYDEAGISSSGIMEIFRAGDRILFIVTKKVDDISVRSIWQLNEEGKLKQVAEIPLDENSRNFNSIRVSPNGKYFTLVFNFTYYFYDEQTKFIFKQNLFPDVQNSSNNSLKRRTLLLDNDGRVYVDYIVKTESESKFFPKTENAWMLVHINPNNPKDAVKVMYLANELSVEYIDEKEDLKRIVDAGDKVGLFFSNSFINVIGEHYEPMRHALIDKKTFTIDHFKKIDFVSPDKISNCNNCRAICNYVEYFDGKFIVSGFVKDKGVEQLIICQIDKMGTVSDMLQASNNGSIAGRIKNHSSKIIGDIAYFPYHTSDDEIEGTNCQAFSVKKKGYKDSYAKSARYYVKYNLKTKEINYLNYEVIRLQLRSDKPISVARESEDIIYMTWVEKGNLTISVARL